VNIGTDHEIDPAARVAVLVAKATVSTDGGAPFDGVRVLPGARVVRDAEAAAQLSLIAKPTRCHAVAANRILELHCRPLTTDEPDSTMKWHRQDTCSRRLASVAAPLCRKVGAT
jgi:hypothetical protein